jgi:hypothetical protein
MPKIRAKMMEFTESIVNNGRIYGGMVTGMSQNRKCTNEITKRLLKMRLSEMERPAEIYGSICKI